jgi:hypothetical protein
MKHCNGFRYMIDMAREYKGKLIPTEYGAVEVIDVTRNDENKIVICVIVKYASGWPIKTKQYISLNDFYLLLKKKVTEVV